ncbi:MAG: hypothetical protein IJ518_01430 [Clostridia bacterium]|nr:hypothetical protein [Clostridia bacterium]
MESTITELWYGNLHPDEQCMEHNPEIKNLVRLMERNRSDLAATLTDRQKETLEKYDDAAAELSAIVERQIFRRGFRLGGRLMLETLVDTPDE